MPVRAAVPLRGVVDTASAGSIDVSPVGSVLVSSVTRLPVIAGTGAKSPMASCAPAGSVQP